MEISAMRIQLSLRGIALQGLCLDFFGVISCSTEAQLFKATNQQVSRMTPMNTKGRKQTLKILKENKKRKPLNGKHQNF